jgi:hypothetical protein
MSNVVDQIREKRRNAWLENWRKNLTNCRNCDGDYFETDVIFAEEKVCPKCQQPLDGQPYYCEEHGSSVCGECEHNV